MIADCEVCSIAATGECEGRKVNLSSRGNEETSWGLLPDQSEVVVS